MITFEVKTILHCKCVKCEYEWDSFKRDKETGKLISVTPDRCANCKYLAWNGVDRRLKTHREADSDAEVPQLHPEDLLATLTANRTILEQLMADFGPCNHPQTCVCEETEVLAKVNGQIEVLTKLVETPDPPVETPAPVRVRRTRAEIIAATKMAAEAKRAAKRAAEKAKRAAKRAPKAKEEQRKYYRVKQKESRARRRKQHEN